MDTLIGRNTEVLGDVRFRGGLHVDGVIKGRVVAQEDEQATLSVSEAGKVEGDVRVPHLILNGTVEGDVNATQRIVLSPKARVNGNVYYNVLEMNAGATVNGQLVHETGGEQLALPSQSDSGKTEGGGDDEVVDV
ncbi:MAG: polymer-forming cytoskeletal protein [Salinisphaeraceae bacterium]|nr:polymer-forming cytoskeletal protein [Salinisphaeraceae bacterium]